LESKWKACKLEEAKLQEKLKSQGKNTGPDSVCDGSLSAEHCCSSGNFKCGEGKGDCDKNVDCAPGLVCGTDNCRGNNSVSHFDCCVKTPVCDGVAALTVDCCSSGNFQCGEGEGDCDKASDCKPGLFCGKDNCQGKMANMCGAGHICDCCAKPETICKKLPNTRYSKDYHHAWLDKLGGLNTALEKCLSNPECVGISTETKQGAQKPHYVWFFKAGHTVKTNQKGWTSYDCRNRL